MYNRALVVPKSHALDTAWLSGWIQPHHLQTAAIAAHRAAFAAHPAAVVVIPSFLRTECAAALSAFLANEAEFRREFGLHSQRHPVAEADWRAAPPGDRFYQMGVMSGVRPDFRLSPNLWTHLRFLRAIEDERFIAFMEHLTGFALARPRITVHAMAEDDFLLSHTDEIDDRRLGLVMYLSQGWRPDFGGVLKLYDGANSSWDFVPEYNSLALFDVTRQVEHEVTAIQPAAGLAARLTISGWIGSRAAAP